jgi:hypothetical protein
MINDHPIVVNFVNKLRLGDCFWHCLYLKKVSEASPKHQFNFYCNNAHHWQLSEIISECPNVKLIDLVDIPDDAVDCWIGRSWYSHPLNLDIIAFLVEWFRGISTDLGLPVVIHERSDMLADYHGINDVIPGFDVLLVNSYPQSGQFGFDINEMNILAERLSARHKVITTSEVPGIQCTTPTSLSDIARISNACRLIVAVSTGPSWGVFNTLNHNRDVPTYVMLREQRIDYGRPIENCRSLNECVSKLERDKWI